MSQIFISHTSALLIYRNNRNQTYPTSFQSTNEKPKTSDHVYQSDINDIKNKYGAIIKNNIDILLAKSSSASYKFTNVHKFNKKLPPNSFAKIQKNLNISSPELLFFQMSSCLSIEKLTLLGMELCGTYSLDDEFTKGFHSNRIPLTTPEKIQKFLSFQSNVSGVRKARKASQILTMYSASPQESRLYIMLCAPTCMGGFGIKNAVLNHQIKLSKKAAQLCGKSILYADICIPKSKIVIEYDSDAFHDNTNQNRKDKARIDALVHDKWQVYNIVPSIIHNEEAFKHIAEDVIKATGVRPRIRVKNHTLLRKQLHDRLFTTKS